MKKVIEPDPLPQDLMRRVLERLQVAPDAAPNRQTLRKLYAAWCHSVPFDNVRKLIHMRSGSPAPLPGCDAADFFENWLRHGTGGTCWSGANPLHALLCSMSFRAERGIATMLVHPHLPPNHGTVRVMVEDGHWYLVDSSILHQEPLRLDPKNETRVAHHAWGVHCTPLEDGRWMVHWRPMHKPDGFDCRLETFGVPATECRERYEQTRGWSPFNYELYARLNRDDEVIGTAFGQQVTLLRDHGVTSTSISHEQRQRLLIEDLGMSEEIVSQLPEDVPTPPPPGSSAASDA